MKFVNKFKNNCVGSQTENMTVQALLILRNQATKPTNEYNKDSRGDLPLPQVCKQLHPSFW